MVFRVHSVGELLFLLLGSAVVLTLLHGVLLFSCIRLKAETLRYDRRRFALRRWEQSGRFYREVMKIHLWKDKVPQHIGRDGFSKARLEKRLTPDYLDAFLRETCRGEWYHTACLAGVPPLLLLCPLPWSVFVSALMVIVHGACIAIQRYNRIRLLTLRRKISRGLQRNHGKEFPADHSEPAER